MRIVPGAPGARGTAGIHRLPDRRDLRPWRPRGSRCHPCLEDRESAHGAGRTDGGTRCGSAAGPGRPPCADDSRSPIRPICALGSPAHADDGVVSVRPSEAAQRHLPIAAPSRSSSPRGQACSPEPCKAAPGRLMPLTPTNGCSMRSRRGHQGRRSLTAGLRTPRPAGHQDLCRQLRFLPCGQSGHPYHLLDSTGSLYSAGRTVPAAGTSQRQSAW
jgi:hypothetical protein